MWGIGTCISSVDNIPVPEMTRLTIGVVRAAMATQTPPVRQAAEGLLGQAIIAHAMINMDEFTLPSALRAVPGGVEAFRSVAAPKRECA